MGIRGGARNLGRDDIGQIAPGFAADFVAWRTDSIGFAGAGKDPVAGLLYCTPSIGSVDLSVINGDVVVRDGELLTLDLKVSCNNVIAVQDAQKLHGVKLELWASAAVQEVCSM